MLRTIIKRDGTRQAFDPAKLNKWAIWSAAYIRERADWSSVVTKAVKSFDDEASSQDLQRELIKQCVRTKRWPESLMAGRLYTSLMHKEIFDEKLPTVRKLHSKLVNLGLMVKMPYTDEDYNLIENIVDHRRDFHMSYAQVKQIRKKYAIQNSVDSIEYETPQFVFIRMAMKLAQNLPMDTRLKQVGSFYNDFSLSRVNAPSPNYLNLGTPLNGYASCCLYASGDSAPSLAVGDHIAYTMTYMSAGIGGIIQSRSIGNPVRGGKIKHLGKMPYYKALAGGIKANLQAGRGGACTTYIPMFDPEIVTVLMAQNPRTPVDKQNRDIHFAWQDNRIIAKKVMKNEEMFLFNIKTAPDLYEAFYSGDQDNFEKLYSKYESDNSFKKTFVNARELLVLAMQQRNEVGTLYRIQIDEVNRHTPHLEPIYSSNLCLEITQPTKPYFNMMDLYSKDHHRGEVSTCSLAGIVITNIKTDEEYEQAAYNSLLMIDECIHLSDYPFPHVEFTAKNRLNAGIGILGLAHHMARKGLKYNTPEGLAEIHKVAERHAYFVIKASLKLGKQRGNAPWIDKTKWPTGWLPIDTYKRTVDELVEPIYQYDWETLRQEIIDNKGIRNSSLIAHMPTESSSKASGAPNGVYPVRDLSLKKTDVSNSLDWVAPDNDLLENDYQMAWELDPVEQAKFYAVIQKFTDQAISADFYRDRTKLILNDDGKEVVAPLTDEQLIEEYRACVKYGVKSQYYNNSFTGGKKMDDIKISPITVTENITETAVSENTSEKVQLNQVSLDDLEIGSEDTRGCAGGFCTL